MSYSKSLAIACILVGSFCTNSAQAQFPGAPGQGYPGAGIAPASYGASAGYYGSHGAPSGGGSALLPILGMTHFSLNAASEGLGYEGSFASAGTTIPLGTDPLNGWWLIDARASISEDGLPFSNIGLVRRTHFRPMNADFGLGVYHDFDADEYKEYGHTFHQIGISAHMWTPGFDVNVNGYVPIGKTNYNVGTRDDCFLGHLLLVQHGFDSALEGFDIDFALRPDCLAQSSGTIHLGAYSYKSDNVDPFTGFQGMLTMQPKAGVTLGVGMSTDDQFSTTGLLQLVIHRGRARGFSPSGRGLDPMRRKEHITRANQVAVIATDPVTAAAYRVVHVDNSASAGGDGTFENPYNTLALADGTVNPLNSFDGDIIFVREGLSRNLAGTPLNPTDDIPGDLTGYATGISLLNRQRLFGDGVAHVLDTVEVGEFTFCSDTDGLRPIITNPAGNVVTLANGNVVAGLQIDGTAIPAPAMPAVVGIHGDNITNATIRNNIITRTSAEGVLIENSDGVFEITGNTVSHSGSHGIAAIDTTGTLLVSGNTSTDNGIGNQSGLHVDLDGGGALATLLTTITGNTFDRNGVGMHVAARGAGTTVDTTISGNASISNNRTDGIQIRSDDGAHHDFRIANNTTINQNGTLAANGSAIDVAIFNGTADGVINNNMLVDNAGNNAGTDIPVGIGASIFGQFGDLDLDITNNLISSTAAVAAGFGGDGIKIDIDTDFIVSGEVSDINIIGNTFTDIGQDIIDVDAFDKSRLDLVINSNTSVLAAGTNTNTINDGILVATNEDSVVRLMARNNSFTAFGGVSMVGLDTNNNSRLISTFVGNTFDTNAAGIIANVSGTSNLLLEAFNNRFVNNTGNGVSLVVTQGGRLIGIFRNNDITLNGAPDFIATSDNLALANSLMALEVTNNNIFSTQWEVRNNGVGSYSLEDDGSNTPVVPLGAGLILNALPGDIEALAVPLRIFP